MSGLQRVDPELYEAAGLDGANWWQKFRVVTLPSIIPELLVVILTATIGALDAELRTARVDLKVVFDERTVLGKSQLLVQFL